MVKLAKAANQQAQKKKAAPPPKKVEEESSEEESSEEEEAPPPKSAKKATPKAVKNGSITKKAESDDDESEESSEEAPPPKKTPAKATPAKTKSKPTPAKAEESDDDDEDDDESEEEALPPKKATKPAAKPPAKVQPAKESDEDDDDEEDSEEEAPPPKKATPGKPAAKAAAKPAAKAPQAEESSDEEDDDDDDSEEEMDTTPAPATTKAKKAGMVKAKEESEEEEDDDDDEEEEDEEEPPAKPAKRKAETKKETPPAKKSKSDGEGFCLFVGNLNPNKDFDELKSALSKFFSKNDLETVEVRLGASRKFGYVDFASEEDLNKALELNGKKVMGQELKLDRAHSKENAQEGRKERDTRTLFVKNLPFSATADDLKELFEDAVDIRLPQGQNGSNRGIAYIEFKSEAEAEKMLEETQGADVQGRSIMVDYVGEKSQKGARVSASGAGPANKTLVVNNLAFSATEESLQSAFEKAISIRIPQRDGRPKGFAFIEFESTDDAKEALENLNNTEIEGRTVRLEYSQKSTGGRDGGPTKTLFVKGLSEDTTDQTLRDSFDGAVGARIVTDRDTGSSKGFGFVDFDNEDDCKAAKEAMEDGEIDGCKVTLDYAKPKGEGGFRGGRGGGGGGGRGGFRGGRGGFGGRGGGRGGGGRGRGGRGGFGGFGGGRGGGGGGFGGRPQGKKIKFDD
ncbi:nucleolin [Nematolebias whitei]|uniref:nucleolin n=1 Tax=Nematolebias whitei TaxID=451745 RepID=UPI00189AD556|nr:nucleolin [Nematolebias whitei]